MNEELLYYHFVFRTYKGSAILTDPDILVFLENTFQKIAEEKGFVIICQNILQDHVHCLVSFDPSHKPEYIIKSLKGISSRELFKQFQTDRVIFKKLWGRSYFSDKIEKDNLNSIICYIKGQKTSAGIDKRFVI